MALRAFSHQDTVMDPLSLTVAASQLLGAVNTVIAIVTRYNEELNKTPRDLERLDEELKGLRGVLEALDSLIIEAKTSKADGNPKLQALIPLYEPLTMYLDDVKNLQAKLELPAWYVNSRRRRSVVAALGWPLKQDEARRELEKMKSFREQLKDAIQVDTIHIAVANRRILNENQRILAELVRSWRAKTSTDHRRDLHRWLAAPDPSSNYHAALRKRNEATGNWLIQSKPFNTWLDTSKSFIWLYGIAGSGKTILTTTAIECAIKVSQIDVGTGVAYFFFDFNDPEKQLPDKMIRSILKQLSIQCPETPQVLSMLFSSCEDSDRPPTMNELLEILRQVLHSFYKVYIVLDALDECSNREDLLEYLDRFLSWHAEQLRILVSSRPERAIEEGIGHLAKGDNRIRIQGDQVNDDIRIYIRGRLDKDPKLKRWQKRPDVRNEIESCLMNKADGMFRLVVCQMDELTTCFTRPQLQERLKSLPKTLDDMYATMLHRIPEEHEQTAIKILQWLTYSIRQLSADEAAEVLCVDVEDDPRFDPERRYPDPQDILEICPGLVIGTGTSVQDSEGTIIEEEVRLAHYSVKEFLVSKRIKELAPSYSLSPNTAHTSMAEVCLAYLLSFDSPASLSPGVLEEFPLAAYAAQHWTKHAKLAEEAESLATLTMELFDNANSAYANWGCLHNPDKPWQTPSDGIKKRVNGEEDPLPPPLYIASLCGLLPAVDMILESEADVNETAGECGNPLQAASRGGHEIIVQRLLEAGAVVNGLGGLYGTALQAAAFWGHARVVQCLLDSAADVNCAGGKYANALHAASREGHLPVVQTLLCAGANVAQRGGFYGDALQAAAFYGHDDIVQALLHAGADVNQQSGGIYGNALQAASRNGHDKVVRDLIAAGARVNDASGMYHTALQSAARGAQGFVIKRLLDAGAEVNAQGGKYGNALQAACLTDEVKVVQQLLEAGANINARGGMYGTALQTVCAHGYEKMVQILLDAHADVNLRGGFLGSAVVAAAKNGHDTILELLLKAGAEVKGWTMTVIVTRTSHRRVIALLEEAGVDINRDGNDDGGGSDALLAQDFEGINIANSGDDDGHIRQAALSVKFCDECGRSIPNGEKYWHCAICLNDDWDSCQACVVAGFPCPGRTHKMVRRQIKGGVIVDVYDDVDGGGGGGGGGGVVGGKDHGRKNNR